MRRAILLFPLLSVLSLGPPLQAQSEGDFWAYLALTLTPTGGFAPLASAAGVGGPASGAFSLRYGQIGEDDDPLHHIGVTADLPAGSGRLGLTAGAQACAGCDALIMLGADWTTPLVERAMADGRMGVGLMTAIGAGIPTAEEADAFLLSASLGVPVSLVAGAADGLQVVPFLTPAIGLGVITGSDSEAGIRPMLGGGLGLISRAGFGVTAGFQKVFIDGGETVIGLAITFGGR